MCREGLNQLSRQFRDQVCREFCRRVFLHSMKYMDTQSCWYNQRQSTGRVVFPSTCNRPHESRADSFQTKEEECWSQWREMWIGHDRRIFFGKSPTWGEWSTCCSCRLIHRPKYRLSTRQKNLIQYNETACQIQYTSGRKILPRKSCDTRDFWKRFVKRARELDRILECIREWAGARPMVCQINGACWVKEASLDHACQESLDRIDSRDVQRQTLRVQ